MKVRQTKNMWNTRRDVEFTGGNSLRMVLKEDGLGFSMHETHIKPGRWHWHYKHHLESCYCIKGWGVIHDIHNGISYPVSPGTVYLLDDHDDHVFEAYEDVVLISVFNPPIVGDESHDENGVYQLKK